MSSPDLALAIIWVPTKYFTDYTATFETERKVNVGAELYVLRKGVVHPDAKLSISAPVTGVVYSPVPEPMRDYIGAASEADRLVATLPSGQEVTAAACICFCPHDHGLFNHALCITCGADVGKLLPVEKKAIDAFAVWKKQLKSPPTAAATAESTSTLPRHAAPFAIVPKRVAWDYFTAKRKKEGIKSSQTINQMITKDDSRPVLSGLLSEVLKGIGSVGGSGAGAARELVVPSRLPPARQSASTTERVEGMKSIKVLHGMNISIAHDVAAQLDVSTKARLHASRKLILLLDLDHTLLHSTNDLGMQTVAAHPKFTDVHTFAEAECTFFTKLRPEVRGFLRRMAEKFELHIDTFGSRGYAQKCASILDPSKELFGDKITSRCDSTLAHKQSAAWMHRTLGDDAMVLIVDDRLDMWPGARNVVLIEPYTFWKFAADVNNTPGTSVGHVSNAAVPGSKRGREHLAGQGAEPELSDAERLVAEEPHAYLLDVERILTSVHEQYFTALDAGAVPTTSDILAQRLSQILASVSIVFSGVFPLQLSPAEQPLYRRTLEFGAAVGDGFPPTSLHHASARIAPLIGPNAQCITHVVGRVGHTQKINDAAAARKSRIVSLLWLQESLKRYQRQPESEFALDGYDIEAIIDIHEAEALLTRLIKEAVDNVSKKAAAVAALPVELPELNDSDSDLAPEDSHSSDVESYTFEMDDEDNAAFQSGADENN